MEPTHWLSLLSICLLGAMSPGPSLAVVLRCAVAGGRRAGMIAALSHGAGVGLYGLLTVAGLALVITRTPALFLALQLGGALYLAYLGAGALLRAPRPPDDNPPQVAHGGAARDGFAVAFLNPKLAVFMLALFSQFLQPQFGVWEKGLMALTVGATDALWYTLVAALVSQPRFLARLRRNAALIERVFGLILLALAASMLLKVLLV